MRFAFRVSLALAFVLSSFGFAHANTDDTARNSCRARAIDTFYCPSSNGDWWYGPYWDNGCSIKCEEGQKAICAEASCDDSRNGDYTPSVCVCR